MQILSLNSIYNILQKIKTTDELDIFVAYEQSMDIAYKRLLIVLKDNDLVKNFLPNCGLFLNNKPFEDFLTFFPWQGNLCLVFNYHDNRTLLSYMSENISLEQRLAVADNLIRRMIFLNIPNYLQYEVLQIDKLVIDNDGSIYFNFYLDEPQKLNDITKSDIYQRIYDIFCQIFSYELQQMDCPPIEQFVSKLDNSSFDTYTDMLKGFEEVINQVKILDKSKQIKPKQLWFKIWEKIKQIVPYVKYTLIILLIISLFVYLIYTLLNPEYGSGEKFDYKYIGTLQID